MKYMTFNRSCAYAGLANLVNGDFQDRDIVKEGGIAYYFCYDNKTDAYYAGSQLQSKKWFDLFLNKHGLEYFECNQPKKELEDFLASLNRKAMLGIKSDKGGKHAVVFTGIKNSSFEFMNMKHCDSSEPDCFVYSPDELIELVDENVALGYIQKLEPQKEKKQAAINNPAHIEKYENEFVDFCFRPHERSEWLSVRDRLLAPLLLDTLCAMEIVGQEKIYNQIQELKEQFMLSLKSGNELIRNVFDVSLFNNTIKDYKNFLKNNKAR